MPKGIKEQRSKNDFIFYDVDLGVEKEQRFQGDSYSGKIIKNHPVWGDLIMDVSTMRVAKTDKAGKNIVPVLFNHNTDIPIGHGYLEFKKSAKIKGELYGAKGTELHGMMEKGFPMQQSVYIEPESIIALGKGESATVNGEEVEGPATIFMDGTVHEVTLTPLGADNQTNAFTFGKDLKVTFNKYSLKEYESEDEDMGDTVQLEKQVAKLTADLDAKLCECQSKDSQISELEKKITELQSKLAETSDQKDALQKEKDDAKKLQKTTKLENAFKNIGKELTDAVKEVYLSMSDEQFEASVEMFVKQKSPNEKLFGRSKTEGGSGTGDDVVEKIKTVAVRLRKEDPKLDVLKSHELARAELGIPQIKK